MAESITIQLYTEQLNTFSRLFLCYNLMKIEYCFAASVRLYSNKFHFVFKL